MTLPTSGADVDLHRDPTNMVLPSTRERDRWTGTTTVALPGRDEGAHLDLEDTVILALLHLSGQLRDAVHVNDVRLMIEAGPDWDEVERRAADDGWTDIVRYAAWSPPTPSACRRPPHRHRTVAQDDPRRRLAPLTAATGSRERAAQPAPQSASPSSPWAEPAPWPPPTPGGSSCPDRDRPSAAAPPTSRTPWPSPTGASGSGGRTGR